MYNIHINIHTYINIHINRGVKLVAAPGQTAGRAQAAGGESADSAHRNSRAQERHVHHLCKRTHSIYRENTFYHRLYTTYTTYVHHLCKRTHSIYREHILSPDAPLFFLPLFSWFPLRWYTSKQPFMFVVSRGAFRTLVLWTANCAHNILKPPSSRGRIAFSVTFI
jgi:hypothetical protein